MFAAPSDMKTITSGTFGRPCASSSACAASIAFEYEVLPAPWMQLSVWRRFDELLSVPSAFL